MTTRENAALDRAVHAIRALRADEGDLNEASLAAQDAVATAILVHGISHRLIAQKAGCPGLAVIDLMRRESGDDQQMTGRDLAVQAARAEALRAERHAADRYVAEVLDHIRREAEVRITVRGQRETVVARDLGVNRASIRNWQGKS
jgi:transposase